MTEEMKKLRLGKVTGTLIGAICGMNPWMTPFRAYQLAMGEAEVKPNEKMEWGNRLEPVIAERYAELHGVELIDPGVVVHPSARWMAATPDRLHADRSCGVEIKTAGARQAKAWAAGVPAYYLAQVAWGQAVTEIEEWRVVALIGGQDYQEYTLTRDRELESALVKAGRRFYDRHLKPGVPPPPDASPETEQWLREQFPRQDDGRYLPSTKRVDHLVHLYREAGENSKLAERRCQKLKNELMQIIGTHEGVRGDWGEIRWKLDRQGGVNWKPLALTLGATDELVEKFRRPAARRFTIKYYEE